jgi:signal transduction histidine kinase
MKTEADALRDGRMPKLEYRLLTRDGRYVWVSDESMVLVDADLLLVQGFMLDITNRKEVEEQLTKRLAELQAMHGFSEALIQKNDLKNLIHNTGEQIRLAFKANNVLIAVHDPTTDLIHFPYDYEDGVPRRDIPIRYGEGMTTKIMEMKKPLLIEKDWMEQSAKLNAIYTNTLPVLSSFSAPIMTNDKVIGVITLESSEREYAFSEIDTRPILTIAANLAVAIEKTRLQESVKKEMEIQERLIRELEMKNEELERFTYTASHDLKSPLITIRGFLGYLEQDAKAGNYDRLNTDIQRISDATEKMHILLSELLELSRIGRVANEKQDTPFGEIVTEALRRVEGQLLEKKVTVRVGGGFPAVCVDRERIIEVIQNLVDNAIKFTGGTKEPMVEIDHILQDGRSIFYVRDNGIGIRREFHKRIFGLFDKLNPDTEGTGVGLALVKRIVEVHGGSIWVDSEEGKGATFYFTLG